MGTIGVTVIHLHLSYLSKLASPPRNIAVWLPLSCDFWCPHMHTVTNSSRRRGFSSFTDFFWIWGTNIQLPWIEAGVWDCESQFSIKQLLKAFLLELQLSIIQMHSFQFKKGCLCPLHLPEINQPKGIALFVDFSLSSLTYQGTYHFISPVLCTWIKQT